LFRAQHELKEQLQNELGFKERDKTPEEEQISDLVNEATNQVLGKYGVPPLDISSDHVHLLPGEAYEDLFPNSVEGGASYNPSYQAIFFSDFGPDERLEFAQTLFHEMIHFKFWNALQVIDSRNRPQTYRTGIATVSRDGRQLFLNSLNEAITEELTQEFFEASLKNHPLFSRELEKKMRPRGYAAERNRYNELLEKIREKSRGRYSVSELKEAFVRAAATGNLLPIARLIEETLGRGAFSQIVGDGDLTA